MTSFLICYPDVSASALTYSASQTYDSNYPLFNSIYGDRMGYAQLSSNQSSVAITYDLGTGNSRTVDHFILGGCAVLKANGVTEARLQGSNDGSTWTDQLGTAAAFQSRTFDGTDDDDIIFTAAYNDQFSATLAAYRYFKVTLAGGSAHKFPVSKIYFGASLDMGKEPDFYDMEVLTEEDSDTWRYHRGQVLMTKAYYPQHKITIEWDGVSDTVRANFFAKLLSNPVKKHVFLYTATYSDPLYDNKLVHCKVVDSECSSVQRKQDWNDIRAVFLEMS